MTYSASTLLSLPIITSGTESGVWGDITNNGLTQYLDISIAGSLSLTTDADVDLAKTAGTSSATNIGSTTAQYMVLNCTGSRTATRNINAPKQSKLYVVINATTGSQSVVLRGGPTTPTTGVTIANGATALCAWNGSDFVFIGATTGSNTFVAAQTFRAANAIRSEAASGQDAVIIAGRAGGAGSYAVTLTPAQLAANRTLTLPEPVEDVTLGYLNIPQNVQTGSYTLIGADSGKQIYRGSGSAATWTIPANSSVAYSVGTALTFINLSATAVSIAITTDTMYLSSAGTTGTRTLAQYGTATAIKIASTTWIITGSGLT